MTDEQNPIESKSSDDAHGDENKIEPEGVVTSEDAASSATAVEDEAPPVVEEEIESDTNDDAEASDDDEDLKLEQEVVIDDIGPCKKHIKVSVAHKNIKELLEKKYAELMTEAQVPGFRPGKVPRRIIVKRFQKGVGREIKGQVLMASLEQLAEEHDIAPLSAPNIDPENLDLPKEDGESPFVYEFEVEVRPEFDLPEYRGLELTRPTKTFTEQEVEKEEHRILASFGEQVPKTEGGVENGDYITADMTTKFEDTEIGATKDSKFRVDDRMAFKDGVAAKFGEQLRGAKVGDVREVDIVMSDSVSNRGLRGQNCKATLVIKEVKRVELPKLTHDFLHNFGVHNTDQLREKVRGLLDSRLEYDQRQSAREQILEKIANHADWDLPQDLLQRQARKAINRRKLEMRNAGMSEEDIRARQRLLEHDVLRSTEKTLKEHFVLQKIAEKEEIDATDADIEDEIENIAYQSNESPRRVRAQLEREDMMETVAIQVVEGKVLDLIMDEAKYTDVPMEKDEEGVASSEEQASEGELRDPTEAPPETEEGTEKTES